MNEIEIRRYFHKKRLLRHHCEESTLVLDELGLKHGKCRADIAVINGHLDGFEIKSDEDTLTRLPEQITNYNLVFDHSTLIVGQRHIKKAETQLPNRWGVILCKKGTRGAISFKTIRKAKINKNVDPVSIAELLWRSEAIDILNEIGTPPKILRKPRKILYECIVDTFDTNEVRYIVRECLKKRKNWRYQQSVSPYGDLCRPISK